MYTEEYENKGFPIRSFLVRALLVIIFVLLLIWLLPKILSPIVNSNNKTSSKCNGETVCDLSGLNALTSQIFADNLERMKDAAISYYTAERLPKEVGESSTMTLSDMIGKKLITPLIDKNNKAVDVEGSYVKITKQNNEYLLKVNIKDSEKEDYILVHLGCYAYCESYLCQKQTSKTTVVPGKSSTPSTPVTPSPEIIKCGTKDGKYFDANGNRVSELNYIISCQAPKCQVVSGYYFGKNGNNVSKSTYLSECSSPTPVDHKCEYYGGKYYDKNGNVVSEVNYIISCQAPKCQVVNGYYFGKNGNNVSKETYDKECSTTVEYLYEYKKTTAAKLSAWTSWGSWEKTNCATTEINCNDSDDSCLYKLQRYDRKEKIGTYQKTYAKKREVIKKIGEYTAKSCSKYKYIKINDTIIATTTTTTYTTVDTITTTTTSTQGGWVYQGRQSFANPPSDTATTHYVFAGADYSDCGETCQTLPKYYYDVYTWQPGTTTVQTTTTPGTPTSSTEVSTTEQTTTSYQAQCGEIKEQVIPIYGTITVTEKAARTEPLYGTVCYQSTKSRTILTPAKVDYKWSTYNDTSLLNAGWVYTGNKKPKN